MNLQRIIDAVTTELGNVCNLRIHTYPDGQQGIEVPPDAILVSTCPHALWRAVRARVRNIRALRNEVWEMDYIRHFTVPE